MVDRARVHVAVDRKLLTRHRVEREARADLGHAPRAFGDHDEIHDQDHAEHDQPDQDRAAHDEIREPFDNTARRTRTRMPVSDNEFRRGDVERQPQHERRKENGGKGGEIERTLDEEGDGEDQDREGEGGGETDVEDPGGHRKDHHRDDRHQCERQQDRWLKRALHERGRHHIPRAFRAARANREAPGAPPGRGGSASFDLSRSG